MAVSAAPALESLPQATLHVPHFADYRCQTALTELAQRITQLLQHATEQVHQLAKPYDFEQSLETIADIDAVEIQLSEDFGILSHLNAVMNSPELRDIYQAVLGTVSNFYSELGQHQVLYTHYQFLHKHRQFSQLSASVQATIGHALTEFKLSSVALPAEQKAQFAQNSAELSQLSLRFSNHVLDATQAYVLALDEQDTLGLPESSRALLLQYGKQHGINGAAATLDFPAYHAIMTYCHNRAIREQLYRAYTTRASELGAPQWDNSAIMQRILQLRLEQAQMLGFKHYAELSLARKMAPDTATVERFLRDLAAQARAPAQHELAAMQSLAAQDGIVDFAAWDSSFYAEKLKQQQFKLSQDVLKPYFPIHTVLDGLFTITQKLYGITIVQKQAQVWHPDVQYFEIEQDGDIIGGFYFDLYARPHKRGGAWMSGFRSRMVSSRYQQKPLAFMVANFAPALDGQVAQLNHDEIVTLFHEFGHGLHHLLTEAEHIGVAGTHAVAWDAVELPSQFMEFWAWQDEALDLISRHVDNGQPLPRDVLKALLAARTFQSGLQTLRQVEFALFDLLIHQCNPAPNSQTIEHILHQTREQIALIAAPAFNRFAHSFSHIFAGGYAAGYYSYKWAEVLASDAFDRFEQEGIFNADTGRAFRQHILAVGGQVDALTAFKNFRGRDPDHAALLRHNGWTASPHSTTLAQEST